MLLDVDPKQKKKKGADYFALDDDLDQEWIKQHQDFLVEDMRSKIKKKFEKDNEKLAAQGDKPHPEKELKERLKAADELAAKYKKENKSNKVEAEGKGPTVESVDAKVKKSEEKIRNLQVQAAERDDNKEVALSTSKIVSTAHYNMPSALLLTQSRTTSTPVSQSSSSRSSTCRLRNSFPRRCVRSSTGPSNQ